MSTPVLLRVCSAQDLRIIIQGSNHVMRHGYKDHMDKLDTCTILLEGGVGELFVML